MCRIAAFWAMFNAFGLLSYLPLSSRYILQKLQNIFGQLEVYGFGSPCMDDCWGGSAKEVGVEGLGV